MWRQIWHVEKFLHMRNVEANLFCHKSCCFLAKSILLPFKLFFYKLIFRDLCEKLSQKLCLWRKKDKYEVCSSVPMYSLGFVSPQLRGQGNTYYINIRASHILSIVQFYFYQTSATFAITSVNMSIPLRKTASLRNSLWS